MTDNQETPGMRHVIDLLVTADTSTLPSALEFQQLINKVQALIQFVLAS
jgi:hypothetical protein